MFLSLLRFAYFLCFFLLLSSIINLYCGQIEYRKLLKFAYIYLDYLCSLWSVLENILWISEMNVYSVVFDWNVLWMSVSLFDLYYQLAPIFLNLFFTLWSIGENRALTSPTIATLCWSVTLNLVVLILRYWMHLCLLHTCSKWQCSVDGLFPWYV